MDKIAFAIAMEGASARPKIHGLEYKSEHEKNYFEEVIEEDERTTADELIGLDRLLVCAQAAIWLSRIDGALERAEAGVLRMFYGNHDTRLAACVCVGTFLGGQYSVASKDMMRECMAAIGLFSEKVDPFAEEKILDLLQSARRKAGRAIG